MASSCRSCSTVTETAQCPRRISTVQKNSPRLLHRGRIVAGGLLGLLFGFHVIQVFQYIFLGRQVVSPTSDFYRHPQNVPRGNLSLDQHRFTSLA